MAGITVTVTVTAAMADEAKAQNEAHHQQHGHHKEEDLGSLPHVAPHLPSREDVLRKGGKLWSSSRTLENRDRRGGDGEETKGKQTWVAGVTVVNIWHEEELVVTTTLGDTTE